MGKTGKSIIWVVLAFIVIASMVLTILPPPR
jgi:hypothetical protein